MDDKLPASDAKPKDDAWQLDNEFTTETGPKYPLFSEADFANYFCSYAQLYHQKHMLADHNRMAAYHSAILGNANVFKNKVVMDVGTGSGILAVWAAQAGARKVYAIEYTDMAKHARKVMEANGVDHIVTVVQGAVEDVELPTEADGLELEVDEDGETGAEEATIEEVDDADKKKKKKKPCRCVDIMISEWMGYFLLRESMLDSLILARDHFLKRKTGLMFPSHTTMFLAPITDEDERRASANEYASAMSDWRDFCNTTSQVYGVQMEVLEHDFEREQREYHLLSSRWMELPMDAVLVSEPAIILQLDMMTCTLEESLGLLRTSPESKFSFDVAGDRVHGPISGVAGWFTADFNSRTDALGVDHAPKLHQPAYLSTGPEAGYTHWGQQVFYFKNAIPCLKGETTRLEGVIEMTRTKANSRLYHFWISYTSSRRRKNASRQQASALLAAATAATAAGNDGNKADESGAAPEETVLMKSAPIEQLYLIP